MKRLIFTLFFTLLLSKSFSQEPIGFYAIAGLSSPQFSSNSISGEASVSPVYGFAFNFGYSSSLNFQIEVLQHSKIFKFNAVPLFPEDVTSFKRDFGGNELGFYLNYFVTKPDEDKVYFSALVGPYFVFVPGTAPTGENPNSFIENSNLKVKNLDGISGIDYGAGLGFCAAYKRFKLNLRYNLGLSNQFKNVNIQNSQDPEDLTYGFKAKSNSLSLGLSFRFFEKN